MKKSGASQGQSASELISKRIAELGDWRGETLSRMRKLINEADPHVVEEWKWMGTLPIELADPKVRPGIERAAAGARANGTPFISFFTPTEMLTLARDAGFREVQHVSAAALAQRYFAGRTDGLRPPNNSEELLVATP